jgi:sugar lactone lactonase YvrE
MRHTHCAPSIMLSVTIATLCASPAIATPPEPIVVSGFETPESVVHDPLADWYLVSNVGIGNPAALDHNGSISKVSPQGVILQADWIRDGLNHVTLNGPKGLALHGDFQYVADVDTLRIFDRFTGAPRRSVRIPNPFAPAPLFLNDVVVDRDGDAYLTDNRNSAIFVVDSKRSASLLVSGPELGGPNGILLDHGSLSWVTFFGREVKRLTRAGRLLTEATLPAPDPAVPGLPPGALFLDGYARDEGDLLVSSWVSGKVYRIGRSGTDLTAVAEFVSALDNPARPDGPADMAIDRLRNRLLIPLFNANQLVIVQLTR